MIFIEIKFWNETFEKILILMDYLDHPVETWGRSGTTGTPESSLSAGYASADTNAFTRLDLIK